LFSTRMEGKVIDLQTGKGIPNAKLVVYESVATKGSSKSNYFQLKTFYADQDGNFNDKIKISFPDEEDESYESFFLKAEPDGYEKTEGRDYPISGTGILPWGYLRLTRVNKNMVLQCNPEYKLTLIYKKNNLQINYLDVIIKKQNERDRLNYPYQKIESIFYYIDTGNTHLLLYNNLDVRYSKIPRGNYQLNIGWEDSNSTNFKDSINIELTQNLTYELDY
jgi:hypothetical protein